MGTPLLRRHNTGLLPTSAGEAIVDGLSKLLDDFAALRTRCMVAAAPNRLRVGIGAALADNWLVRRLPDFAVTCPQTSIELVVLENEAPELTADLDVRILWVPASELKATSSQSPLFQEQVFPVCSPSLIPSDFVLGDPSILSKLPLLHKGPAGRGTIAEWSWPSWLERSALPPRTKESFRFASIGPAIAAAHEGAGIVLARSMLVHDALENGRLVRVLPPCEDRPSSKAHIVRWPSTLRNDERSRPSHHGWSKKRGKRSPARERHRDTAPPVQISVMTPLPSRTRTRRTASPKCTHGFEARISRTRGDAHWNKPPLILEIAPRIADQHAAARAG